MSMTRFPKAIGGFEVLGSLGQGGMGIVYCARDHTLQRELAIKVQSGDWKEHPEALQRFLREARILAQINHPNVVQIYSVGEHEGAPFFVMELLQGSIADAARLKLPGIDQAKRWILEAARGLAAIHEMGVVHRDIKPGNLLLTRATSVEPEHVKVADLGIARASAEFGAALTRVGVVLGTGGYLAPEALRLARKPDSRADQYSLGVVFYELLARRAPYSPAAETAPIVAGVQSRSAPDVREFRPEVDAATAEVLARMLSDDPEARFPNTAALVQALSTIQGPAPSLPLSPTEESSGPQAPPPPPALPAATGRVAPLPAGRSWQAWTAALLFVAALLVGTVYWRSMAPGEPVAATPADVQSIAAMQREAWAKYLIAHYELKSANGEAWTLDLLEQASGVLAAELKGAETGTVELTGRVDAQEWRTVDGVKWDSYRLTLMGAGGRSIEGSVEFSDDATAGTGSYVHAGATQAFVFVDSDDFPD
jgi:hypothetical protein